MLDNLPPDTLPRLMRRTVLSTLIVGAAAFVVAMLFAPPMGALGLLVGLVLAVVNLRMLDRQIARVQAGGEASTKSVRRQMGGRTSTRLGAVTLIVVAALILSAPFGIGIVSGLVLYQIVFVANVFRVVTAQGGLR